jgi:hypothetical protein
MIIKLDNGLFRSTKRTMGLFRRSSTHWQSLEMQDQKVRMHIVRNCDIQIKTFNVHGNNNQHFYIFVFTGRRLVTAANTADPSSYLLSGSLPRRLTSVSQQDYLACPIGPRDTASGRTQQKTQLPGFPLLLYDVTTEAGHIEKTASRCTSSGYVA